MERERSCTQNGLIQSRSLRNGLDGKRHTFHLISSGPYEPYEPSLPCFRKLFPPDRPPDSSQSISINIFLSICMQDIFSGLYFYKLHIRVTCFSLLHHSICIEIPYVHIKRDTFLALEFRRSHSAGFVYVIGHIANRFNFMSSLRPLHHQGSCLRSIPSPAL